MTTQDPRYKHKPSEKHTLEEVLKSLQDLIRNDLPGDKSAAGAPQAPTADANTTPREEAPGKNRPEPPPQRATPRREDFAPVNPAAGPVNLDAVMRSLKDLIGNELNVGDQPAAEQDLTPPLPEDDLLASAEEALGPLDDEPTFEEPDEPGTANELAPAEEDLTPPLPEEDLLASAAEALAPLDHEPTFEEPDEPGTGNALAPAEEDFTPPLPEDDFLDIAAETSAPSREEPADKRRRQPGPANELTPPAITSAAEQPVVEKPIADEFVPLDEELAFEETVEAAPPPDSPELPGEISPKLLAKPAEPAPAAEKKSTERRKIAPDAQQELLFDEPVPLIIERQSPGRETERKTEMKPEPVTQQATPETPVEPATPGLEATPEPALSTIDVEETVEDSAYFDVETPLAASPSSEETDAPAVAPVAPTATASENTGDNMGTSGSMSADTAAAESSPPETGLKLEIAEEPAMENSPNTTSVDFDSIDSTPSASAEAPGPSDVPAVSMPAAGEPPISAHDADGMPSIDFETLPLAPEKEVPAPVTPPEAPSPAAANEPAAVTTPAAAESTTEVTMTKKPVPDEIKTETAPAPESDKAPDDQAPRPAAGKKRARATAPESKPPVTAKFNLDDIPVLHEVVAPPAGSMLAPPPAPPQAPLPAPDRARDIVVRAVAKLNVELRKSGGAGLDTKTILRLQNLIRQGLEKDGEK